MTIETTWTTKTLDRAGTITLGLKDGAIPAKVFFTGEALEDASEEGVKNVSDDTASLALVEVQRLTGVRCKFVGWSEVDGSVVGKLAAV